MKSIANQYRDLKEGKMTQSNFMRNLRMSMPQYITNVTSFKDAVRILKNKAILTESAGDPPISQMSREEMIDFLGTTAEKVKDMSDEELRDAVEDKNVDLREDDEEDEMDDLIKKIGQEEEEEKAIKGGFGIRDPLEEETDQERDSRREKTSKELDQALLTFLKGIQSKSPTPEIAQRIKDQEAKMEKDYGSLEEGRKKKEPKKELHPNAIHPQELRMGIKVELEHTDDLDKAKKIALDHLAENPFYYTALKLAGVESPSAPKTKAPVEKKAKKKKEAVELVDKANAMQKVKMPKIVKEAQISAALPNEEINNTTKQVLQYVDSDIANPVLKALSKDIRLQSLRDNRTLLRYMYWEPLPDPAIRALELQFKVEGDTDIDDDTAPREYYILSPKSNAAKNLGSSLEAGTSKASQMDAFKEALEKLVRETLAETFDGRDNLANITDDTK